MERWSGIPGFSFYEASSEGRIRSLDRTLQNGKKRQGVVLKTPTSGAGYPHATLRGDDGRQVKLPIHRFIAWAFLGPQEGQEVRHWDDDPNNNRISNLLYGSGSDNQRDRVRNGHHWQSGKVSCPNGHSLNNDNLVPSQLKLGYRSCLSCSRGRDRCRRNPALDLQQVSDEIYKKLTG